MDSTLPFALQYIPILRWSTLTLVIDVILAPNSAICLDIPENQRVSLGIASLL